jgi:hypothetical protein
MWSKCKQQQDQHVKLEAHVHAAQEVAKHDGRGIHLGVEQNQAAARSARQSGCERRKGHTQHIFGTH